MALDYLTVPGEVLYALSFLLFIYSIFFIATSVEVERLFSKGWLLLSQTRNRLSVKTTRAVLCLGAWSSMGLIKDLDIQNVCLEEEVNGTDEDIVAEWELISG